MYGPDLKAAIVQLHCNLSIGSPKIFPISVSQLAAHYIEGIKLRPDEFRTFRKRTGAAIRSLEKRKLIVCTIETDETNPHRLPKKLIHVWKQEG